MKFKRIHAKSNLSGAATEVVHPAAIRWLTALAAFVALTACGGGGGNSPSVSPAPSPAPNPGSPVPSPTPPPTNPPPAQPPAFFIPSSVRSQAATPTYPVGSLNRYAFDTLNSELGRCGFGYSNQDLRLDRAAKAHGDWMAVNNQFSHTADGTRFPNGFTGTTPGDRARFQGYPNDTGEDLALTGTFYGDAAAERQSAEFALRSLLAAPFHLGSLAGSARDVGIAYTRGGDLGLMQGRQNSLYLTIVPASVATQPRQDISSDEVVTYPCEGTTGVHGAVYGEDPNPVPGRNLLTNPIGNGVLVRTNIVSNISVTSFSMVEAGTTTPIRMLPPVVFNASQIFFSDAPLKRSTRYSVTVRGSANNVPFSKTFTFTTGVDY